MLGENDVWIFLDKPIIKGTLLKKLGKLAYGLGIRQYQRIIVNFVKYNHNFVVRGNSVDKF